METPAGQGRAEGTPNATSSSASPCAPEALRRDARFRHLVHRLHQLGPRPVGELLLEFADAYGIEGDILARLEKLAELDPAAVARLGERIWPPVPLSEVA
jgi:hypothetical protein